MPYCSSLTVSVRKSEEGQYMKDWSIFDSGSPSTVSQYSETERYACSAPVRASTYEIAAIVKHVGNISEEMMG